MKVSDFICKELKKKTDYAFVGQGSSILHLLHSAKKYNLKIIPSQNEQCAAIASDAYSKCSKKIGLTITTSGPGTLNAFQGIASSFYDSVPSIYLSGAPVKKFLMKKNSKLRQLGFQEMDMRNITKKFTKYSTRITDLNKVKYELDKALYLATSDRQGPCLIEIPDDIQRSIYNPKKQKKFIPKIKKRKINISLIKKFNKLLSNSQKPLIVGGYGLKKSAKSNNLLRWAKKNKIPFVLTYGASDLANTNDKLNAGPFGVYATKFGNMAIQNCDLLIILGCKLNPTLMGSNPKKFADKAIKIQVDIDKEELKEQNHLKTDLKICANLDDFIEKIQNLKNPRREKNIWINKINEWKKIFPILKKSYISEKKFVNPYYFFNQLSEKIHRNSIIINDTSNNMVWMHQSFKIKSNQNIFSAYNHSPMGYSMPASIGAHLADKNKQLIAIIGDGGFQMNIQELQTIFFFKIPVKIFVIQNKTLGMVTQAMDSWFKSDYVACDEGSGFSLPNFKKIIKGYKIKTFDIFNNKDVKPKLKKILGHKHASVTIVNVSKKARMIPKVKLGDPLDKI